MLSLERSMTLSAGMENLVASSPSMAMERSSTSPGDTYMIFMEGIEGAECHGIGFQKDGLRGLVHAAVRFGRLHSASDGSVAAYDMIRLYKDPQFGTGGQECLGTAAHSDIRMVGDDNRSLPISFFFK